MEYVSTRPAKLPSKFSGMFQGLSKVWKRKSSGTASGNHENRQADMDRSINEETENMDANHSGKIHPQPFSGTLASNGVDHLLARNLFESISSLKLAYIHLQRAHIPYDPAKIRSADELVVSHLQSLSSMEQFYLERPKNKPSTKASLSEEILWQEELLESLVSQVQAKDSEVLRLGWEVEELVKRNMELEDEIKRTFLPEEELLISYKDPDPSLFPLSYKEAHKSIHEFSKPLIGLMKASEWSLDHAADYLAPRVSYAQRSHKKYAFEAYISRKMFALKGISWEEFRSGDIGSVLRFRDPFDALIHNPDSNFARFCLSKYASLVHPLMEQAFFGHLDQRNFISKGKHPRTPFYRVFVKMARWVWVLLVMAARVVPEAVMFYARKRSKFVERHMESVAGKDASPQSAVAFTVTPGFWIGNRDVVRCRVYVSWRGEA